MNGYFIFFAGIIFVLPSVFAITDGDANNQPRATIPDNVDIYFIEETYAKKVGIPPSAYPTSYKIPKSGTYSIIRGSTVEISSSGVVKPKGTTWYWKGGFGTTAYMSDADRVVVEYDEGVTTIRVKDDDFTQDFNVTVHDYVTIFVDNLLVRIVNDVAYSGLTGLQKLQNITRWVGTNTDYCVNYQSYRSMLLFECGDCWASTNTIVAMCGKAGLTCKGRRGNQDGGAGSGHRNVIAYIDGKYYIAEAGYSGNRPRGASVYEEPYGFSVSGNTIYQYDGDESDLTIPSVIGSRNISVFGRQGVTVFIYDGLTALHFPTSIESIGRAALYGTDTLRTITVDPDSEFLEAEDNVLYTKWKETLIYATRNRTSFTIDPNTTTLGYCCLSNCNFSTLVIPGTVKVLDMAFLYDTTVGNLTIEYGVETLGETAFQGLHTSKVVLPNSIKDMGLAPFYRSYISEVVLPSNITEIPMGCFEGSTIKTVEIPETVVFINDRAFYGCYSLKNITIPTTVEYIGENVFPSGLTNIYYNGSKKQWKRLCKNCSLADSTEVHWDSTIEDDEEEGEFPVIAGIVLGMVGAGAVAAIVAVVFALVRKNMGTGTQKSSPNSVELGNEKPKQEKPVRAAPTTPPAEHSRPPPPPPVQHSRPPPPPAERSRPMTPPRNANPKPNPRASPAPPPRGNPATPPRGSPATPPRGRPAPPPR